MSNFLKTARAFVIDEFSSCDQFIQFHLSKYRFKLNYIGIDCEWVNNEDQEPVALLQIATPMNDCFLVRLCKMSGQMPQIVKEILEDKAVVKFGVGIQNDAERLKMIGIHAQGCVDLRDVAWLENRDQSCQEMSLDALAKRILGVALNKSQGIQCSNWEQEKLSSQQIEYAANDALVAIHMFLTLVKEKVKQSSDVNDFSLGEKNVSLRGVSNEDLADGFGYTVNLSQFESGEREGYLATKEVRNLLSHPDFAQTAGLLCQDLIDIPFKERKRKPVSKFEHSISSDPEKFQKPSKDDKTRKSPLYKDCILTAPDGSRLCTLDDKKADWYIDRGLGHLTNLDPYTVQLNFEPAGRPDDYDLNFKDNVCVVCGSGESYMRKRIIPHEYRRQFPLEMKVHQPHDILLTCPRCHSLANFFDDQLRKELAIKYNAPLEMFHVEDPKLREVKWAAKGLSDGGNRIPEDRRQKLSHIVQKHFSASPLTPEMISQAATMETLKENANFVSHGFEVVERFRSEGKLLEFEKMWRKHFFDTMQPKFLPPWWSVDHRHEILKEKIHSDVGR